jgi:hypothetical protein
MRLIKKLICILGPFVHMSAIVASLLSKLTRRFQNDSFFANEGKEVQILSAGCAVVSYLIRSTFFKQ